VVLLKISNILTQIDGYLPRPVKKQLTDDLSFLIKDADFVMRALEDKARKKLIALHGAAGYTMPLPFTWDGRRKFFDEGNRTFPTGFYSRVHAIMAAHGLEFDTVDLRPIPPETQNFTFNGPQLRDYQEKVVMDAIARQRGIINLPTGAGKTVVIGAILARLNRRAIVLIHRETIFNQLVERLSGYLGIEVGQIGAGKFIDGQIVVAMAQTVTQPQYLEWLKQFPVLICDEVHVFPAETFNSVLNSCTNAYYRFGTSATPDREDKGEMFLEAALGGFISRMGPSELIEQGHLIAPKIIFVDVPKEPKWDTLSFPAQYKKCVVENEYRNSMIADIANEFKVVGRTGLITVTQINHGATLFKLIKSRYPDIRICFLKGDDDSEDKRNAIRQLNKHELDIIVGTSIFNIGVDIPSLGGIVNAKANDSNIETLQLIGRMLRTDAGKDSAIYVDFMDGNHYLKQHAAKRFNTLKAERAFELARVSNIKECRDELNIL
jgi:superfamily II DNA or RNA helicase